MQLGEAVAARLVALTDAADPAAQNNLGVVLLRAGYASDAERAFGRALALDGGMAVARRNLRAVRHGDEASARWARVREDATNDDAWRALVRHYATRGDFDTAAALLERWTAAAPPTAVAPAVERVRVALDAGRPAEALAAVTHARELAQDAALLALLDLLEARAAYQCGDAARALSCIERVRAVTPDDVEAELLRSFVLGELGAVEAAAASRARAASLDPTLTRVATGLDAETVAVDDGAASPPSSTRDSVLAMATAFRHKGYAAEALTTLTSHTEQGGDADVVQGALGVLHLVRGALHEARPTLSAAVSAAVARGVDPSPYLLATAATHLLAGEDVEADASARTPGHAEGAPLVRAGALNVRALVAWRRGDVAAARSYLLDAAAAARGLDAQVRAALAANLSLLLADAGLGPGAVIAGAAAVRLAPLDAVAHATYGRALAHQGDHAAAQDALARACALAPDDPGAQYGLAFAAGSSGDRDTARLALARATALSPVVRGPAPRLVIAEGSQAVVIAADGSATRGSSHVAPMSAEGGRSSTRPSVHEYAHVDARLAAGEYDRALAAAEAAIARGASRVGGAIRAGHALARSDRLALALDRYLEAAAAAPHDAEPETHVVRTLYRLGRLDDVTTRATAAVERWPDEPAFAALLARAAGDRGDVEGAVAALERCATQHADAAQDPAGFWADVACAWQALGAWDAAAEAWAEAARAVPTLAGPALARAHALARAGDADAADAVLAELATRAPELPDVWRARAQLAIAAGELPTACEHLGRVVARDAGDVDALAGLAAARADISRYGDARVAAEQALQLDPDHPLALSIEGACAAAAGDAPAACRVWRRSLAISPVGAGAARARAGLRAWARAPESARA